MDAALIRSVLSWTKRDGTVAGAGRAGGGYGGSRVTVPKACARAPPRSTTSGRVAGASPPPYAPPPTGDMELNRRAE